MNAGSPLGQCDVAVNCSGLGARQLCGDTRVLPLRGQILRYGTKQNFFKISC